MAADIALVISLFIDNWLPWFQDFENMEADTVAALSQLTGELAGNYHPLAKMDEATQNQLIQDHFLFRNDDE